MTESSSSSFEQFALPETILKAISEIGFETPSPIQEKTIPLLLEGHDVLGLAQTGTGKTAAFSLPLIAKLDPKLNAPQMLVLAPTRELANQVADAIKDFSRHIPGLRVLPIYGGADYGQQIKELRRGPQIVVGTPGRTIDHLDRGKLKLDQLKALVLDEADEMLRMGFIDDVERIMRDMPKERQTALFSATMPPAIKNITKNYMSEPKEVKIAAKTQTVSNIEQFYWHVAGLNKIEALARILEVNSDSASIIFARTKTSTTDIAERLEAKGFSVAALNGDMNQSMRERTITRLKSGKLDIVVATDVAARGLDVERIGLVVNFDIPYDAEAYVHRIGRTGRAGRSGKAVMFVGYREQRLLRNIERVTRQKIEQMQLPTREEIEKKRVSSFQEKLAAAVENAQLEDYQTIASELATNLGMSELELATALLFQAQTARPFKLPTDPEPRSSRFSNERGQRGERSQRGERGERNHRGQRGGERGERPSRNEAGAAKRKRRTADVEMNTYRVDAGKEHGVQTKHIVGAIANEANISSDYIGSVKLFDSYSTVELPSGMPEKTFNHLKRSFVRQRAMRLELIAQ
ncbi:MULTISPECIES: DEAD/DEAH box helicase [unclassified Agarivorans]|uniref:DEAD/DEAH box helicase n=1 Tax=unclassified Agarivorans TaxID=2636026 RepID=UPI0010ECB7D4|nr:MULTISPECIES: DEAD/DEAH box helicase [unclassified Agarivorans]MDO6686464.1 DEAD/DEAH box helicase [Agarivorans sp. 3_MG-2023]MDO6713766.1 DEAD/DEAH box helicase [Agarivorans sp. 2_MG-2023]GDY25774.1 ATP-dependent RNA helicase DeaD [Agarivorans sp. Toyoura001]